MVKEIERRFLVDPSLLPEAEGIHYVQGFLRRSDRITFRVRVSEQAQEALLVVKGPMQGVTRLLYAYEIPIEDGREMLAMCNGRTVEKIRYKIDYKGHEWVVDRFLGENEGLWLAEIELGDENEHFERPPWLREEVSHDPRYYNLNLSKHPFKQWHRPHTASELTLG